MAWIDEIPDPADFDALQAFTDSDVSAWDTWLADNDTLDTYPLMGDEPAWNPDAYIDEDDSPLD